MAALILAAGESRRMGIDKAWLRWQGRPLIARAVDTLHQLGVTEILVSGRTNVDYSTLGCTVLLDLEPGLGPLGGIERGLHRCAAPLLLVLAVDLPLMTATTLALLAARCDSSTGILPRRDGGWEPLAAVYPKRCHRFALERLRRGSRAAQDFAEECVRAGAVRPWTVPACASIFFTNWNQPDDLLSLGAVAPPVTPTWIG